MGTPLQAVSSVFVSDQPFSFLRVKVCSRVFCAECLSVFCAVERANYIGSASVHVSLREADFVDSIYRVLVHKKASV